MNESEMEFSDARRTTIVKFKNNIILSDCNGMNIHARNCPKRDISKFIDLNKIHPYNSLSVVSMKVSLVNQTILHKT